MITAKLPRHSILHSSYTGRRCGKTLQKKPGVPTFAMCNGRLEHYPKGEMRRLGAWVGDRFATSYSGGKRPPGKKAREVWDQWCNPVQYYATKRVPFLFSDVVARKATAEFTDEEFAIRFDRRTGVAYTYSPDHSLDTDELSPWRRGVIR